MGICRYCGLRAGWFSDAHDSCIEKAKKDLESIDACMADAVLTGKTYSAVSSMTEKLIGSSIPDDQARSALQSGWSKGAELRCKKEPISLSEFSEISDLYKGAGFKAEDMVKTPGFRALTLSYLIWSVLNDQIDPYQGPIKFNLQAGETPVFGLANVLLSEKKPLTPMSAATTGQA